ncbi:MAG: tail fiber protein [Rhizobiaceae bacterium]|nr:tail fiber protein [Rhizobiaceae bacterium]
MEASLPFDPNGNYNLPVGYLAVTGQTILASQHNPPLEDIQAALNQALLRSGVAPWTGAQNANGQKLKNLAAPSDPGDAVPLSFLQTYFPSGAILDYAGTTAPSGWLFAGGQAVSRSTYAALFGVLGTRFGGGDGSTTFNLPDLRGRVTAGKDDMNGTAAGRLTSAGGVAGTTLGASGGAQTQTLTVAQMPNHGHAISQQPHHHNWGNTARGFGLANGVVGAFAQGGSTPGDLNTTDSVIDISVQPTGGGQAHNNVQPTIVLNKIIKV